MDHLIKSARLWAISATLYRGAVVVAIAAALATGEGSISITWGAH